MKLRSVFLAGLALLGLAGAAHAGNLSVSIGLGIPGPVYYAPAPVYVQPAPVYYYEPPPRVVYQPAYYVRPAPVYYQTYVYAPSKGKHRHRNKGHRHYHDD